MTTMPVGSLIAVIVLFGMVAALTMIVLMAESLLRPPRMNDGKAMYLLRRLSPGDLKLPFEEMWFRLRDERGALLRLAAWWIPAPANSDRCVVMIHGYADAKIGAIAWAPLWHELGFNILAIDLRAHGQSDGRYCTGGWFERHDVSQAIDQLLMERPEQTRRIALFGASFGASVAAAVGAMRSDIGAVVLDSPYVDFTRAAMRQMDRLGAPGKLFQLAASRLAARIAGAELSALPTTQSIAQLRCPVMVIQPSVDPTLSIEDVEAIRRAIAQRHESSPRDRLWHVEGAGHLLALAADPERYARELSEFLTLAGLGQKSVDSKSDILI